MGTYDPTDMQAQGRERERMASERKLSADTERDDIRWLMKSRRGRRIMWRILEQSRVFQLSFNTNAMAMAFNEGNRNSGLHLLNVVHTHCPENYQTMVEEANERRAEHDRRSRNDH